MPSVFFFRSLKCVSNASGHETLLLSESVRVDAPMNTDLRDVWYLAMQRNSDSLRTFDDRLTGRVIAVDRDREVSVNLWVTDSIAKVMGPMPRGSMALTLVFVAEQSTMEKLVDAGTTGLRRLAERVVERSSALSPDGHAWSMSVSHTTTGYGPSAYGGGGHFGEGSMPGYDDMSMGRDPRGLMGSHGDPQGLMGSYGDPRGLTGSHGDSRGLMGSHGSMGGGRGMHYHRPAPFGDSRGGRSSSYMPEYSAPRSSGGYPFMM